MELSKYFIFFIILILLLGNISMLFLNVFQIVEKYIYNVDTGIYISEISFIIIPISIIKYHLMILMKILKSILLIKRKTQGLPRAFNILYF